MEIRLATHSDIPSAILLFLEAAEESEAYKSHPLNMQKVATGVTHLVSKGITLLAVDKEPVGVLSAWLHNPWFSDSTLIEEELFFIKPEYRGTGAASKLLKAYLKECEKHSPAKVNVGASLSPSNFDKMQKLYSRAGMSISGFTMSKGV